MVSNSVLSSHKFFVLLHNLCHFQLDKGCYTVSPLLKDNAMNVIFISPCNLWVAQPGEPNPDQHGLLPSEQKSVDRRSLITGGQPVYWYEKKKRKQSSGTVSVRQGEIKGDKALGPNFVFSSIIHDWYSINYCFRFDKSSTSYTHYLLQLFLMLLTTGIEIDPC